MDSLGEEFDAAWEQFLSLESLRLLPETLESAWTRGLETYLAFLVGIDEPAVLAHLRSIVRTIEGIPGVEPYPESYWHATIKGIGFGVRDEEHADGVGEEQLARIANAARKVFAWQPAFEIQIGPPNGFPEVVFAEVWGSLPVREMNVRLLEAAPELVRYPFDGEVFLPHVSVARFTSNDGLRELKEALAEERREIAGGPRLFVDEVRLVRAHLSAAAPRLETIESYRLGGVRS